MKKTAIAAALALSLGASLAHAQTSDPLGYEVSQEALQSLYASSPAAKSLGDTAHGVLVFPSVTRAGFILGGQGGDGVLFVKGKPAGHYSTSAASIGLQAGAQSFSYVLFFMSDEVLKRSQNSSNVEIGVVPTIVVGDSGAAKDINTLTAKSDVYAMIFDQKGLMAGIALQGSEITKK